MMNRRSKKEFDAVGFMRDIRDKLSKEYSKNPDQEEKDLIKIRKKYHIKSKVALSKSES